ncbi:IS3 family transposase [Prosthecobacter sp.]|uniref:IS3 family transposase n=1 Tax=Prosthecobacter sp. TaxID=1965333 RepID=UPI002ABA3466|nr:IS3 family transposase [Prosthecobacter sp.]MDZ4403530.1 IS3 family transposase [Prosthecobacter sp.]
MISHPGNTHCLTDMRQTLEVSRSGYYDHTHKAHRQRRQQDQAIATQLVEGFKLSRQTYGSPRLREVLKAQGLGVSRRRISRLMAAKGLRPKAKRRFVPKTTHSNHCGPIAANLLQQRRPTPPTRLNEIWVKDICFVRCAHPAGSLTVGCLAVLGSYIPTREGWLYLDATLDLCSRRVLGWHASAAMPVELVITSLRQAYSHRGVPLHDLIVHIDRGCQYASAAYRADLTLRHAIPSMSRTGNCYDNAAMESFWATLKTEAFGSTIPATRSAAITMIFDYITTFYNSKRLHSSLDYMSPLDFEASLN